MPLWDGLVGKFCPGKWTGLISQLAPSCSEFIGDKIVCEPMNGHGWIHQDPAVISRHGEFWVPPPFRVQVRRLYRHMGVFRGIVGRIIEPSFPYHDFWIATVTRHLGTWDFTFRLAHSNILICPQKPRQLRTISGPTVGRYWPNWQCRGTPQAFGFGGFAESLQRCWMVDCWQEIAHRLSHPGDDLPVFQIAGHLPSLRKNG